MKKKIETKWGREFEQNKYDQTNWKTAKATIQRSKRLTNGRINLDGKLDFILWLQNCIADPRPENQMKNIVIYFELMDINRFSWLLSASPTWAVHWALIFTFIPKLSCTFVEHFVSHHVCVFCTELQSFYCFRLMIRLDFFLLLLLLAF